MGIALGLAMTIGMAGAVTYFVTQETNVLTTQESFLLSGSKLTKVGDIQILSFSIKNTGTSALSNPSVTVHGACKISSVIHDDTSNEVVQINPGASFGFNHEINDASCNDDTNSADANIALGTSYIVDVELTAIGTGSLIRDTITVTARS